LKPKFLGSDPVPALERAMKRRRFRISQQIRDLADGKAEVLQVMGGGLASRGIKEFLVTGTSGGRRR
jgi:hypothetical protein